MYRIPGFHVRHNQDGVEFACSKDKEDLGGVPTVIRGRAGDSQHPSRLIGKMNAMNSVIPPAPVLWEPSDGPGRRVDQDYKTVLDLSPASREELNW